MGGVAYVLQILAKSLVSLGDNSVEWESADVDSDNRLILALLNCVTQVANHPLCYFKSP